MAAEEKARKLSIFIFLVIFGIVGWHIAPMFLPVYKWMNVDFKKIAAETGKPQAELEKVYTVTVRYRPRGNNDLDPAGWEILVMDPEWGEMHTEEWSKEDEYHVYVRCRMISDRTGSAPSQFTVGKFYYDRYFTCKAQRLPPRALKQKSSRPVLLYQADTLTPLDRGGVQNFEKNKSDWYDHDIEYGNYADGWETSEIISEEGSEEAVE